MSNFEFQHYPACNDKCNPESGTHYLGSEEGDIPMPPVEKFGDVQLFGGLRRHLPVPAGRRGVIGAIRRVRSGPPIIK